MPDLGTGADLAGRINHRGFMGKKVCMVRHGSVFIYMQKLFTFTSNFRRELA
jgi:hypothetical protein